MPKVEINPSSGPLTVFYTISTPENPNATEINPSLPTILFLHPVFCPSEIWEGESSLVLFYSLDEEQESFRALLGWRERRRGKKRRSESSSSPLLPPSSLPVPYFSGQFQDSELRRCNLVAIDLRLHGQTEGGMPEGYTFIVGFILSRARSEEMKEAS